MLHESMTRKGPHANHFDLSGSLDQGEFWPELRHVRPVYETARGIAEAQCWTTATGVSASRLVIRHPGAVAMVAQPSPDQLVLVRQFRYGMASWTWEIPAGTGVTDEHWRVTATRELAEETGWQAGSWQHIHDLYPAPGLTNEILRLVQALDLQPGAAHPESDEVVQGHVCTRSEVVALLRDGQINDSKTMVALAWLGWWPCP